MSGNGLINFWEQGLRDFVMFIPHTDNPWQISRKKMQNGSTGSHFYSALLIIVEIFHDGYPSKHKTITQCWFSVETALQTMDQY